jgi:hypothetical protein
MSPVLSPTSARPARKWLANFYQPNPPLISPMPLRLRPSGPGFGIDKDRPDYGVYSGQWEIGRIYQTRGGPESLRWFWSMNANGPMTARAAWLP